MTAASVCGPNGHPATRSIPCPSARSRSWTTQTSLPFDPFFRIVPGKGGAPCRPVFRLHRDRLAYLVQAGKRVGARAVGGEHLSVALDGRAARDEATALALGDYPSCGFDLGVGHRLLFVVSYQRDGIRGVIVSERVRTFLFPPTALVDAPVGEDEERIADVAEPFAEPYFLDLPHELRFVLGRAGLRNRVVNEDLGDGP